MARAGLAGHVTLRRFAAKIQERIKPEDAVAVASHDIHEKEFQVYFDRLVHKIGNDHEGLTRWHIAEFFQTNERVFFLISDQGLEKCKDVLNRFSLVILDEQLMIRKRYHFDRDFLAAFFRVDQKIIQGYLKEKIYLVSKDNHA